MKNITLFFAFALCIISIPTLAGAQSDTDALFKLTDSQIVNYADIGITQFNIDISEQDPRIAFWKIRLYCEEGVSIFVPSTNMQKDACNTVATFTQSDLDKMILFFKNDSKKLTKFKFKLKAYDVNGKWLDTQKKSYNWK